MMKKSFLLITLLSCLTLTASAQSWFYGTYNGNGFVNENYTPPFYGDLAYGQWYTTLSDGDYVSGQMTFAPTVVGNNYNLVNDGGGLWSFAGTLGVSPLTGTASVNGVNISTFNGFVLSGTFSGQACILPLCGGGLDSWFNETTSVNYKGNWSGQGTFQGSMGFQSDSEGDLHFFDLISDPSNKAIGGQADEAQTLAQTPEPDTLLLFGSGLLGVFTWIRQKKAAR